MIQRPPLFVPLLAISAFLLPRPSVVKACSGSSSDDAALIRQIESKFDLRAQGISFKCGGKAIDFRYTPPENLVPEHSFFAVWNKEFSLGYVSSEAELQAMLALSPEQMRALVMANVHFIQDAYAAENELGVHAYHPDGLPASERLSDRGMLMYVTAPHCWGSYAGRDMDSTSARQLGSVYFPVYSLEGIGLLGSASLYRKGDAMRLILADDEVRGAFKRVVLDNLVAVRDAPERASWCSWGMERGARVPWEAVLRRLP